MKKTAKLQQRRVGIYSGTFDPVHAGHIAFALQAIKAAKLDQVYLMPERQPRAKPHVTHYAHRVAMIERAARPYAAIEVLESEDRFFSTVHTLSRLQRRFEGATLVYLCGSDVLTHMGSWSHVTQLLENVELCVGIRAAEARTQVDASLAALPVRAQATTIIESYAPAVSSSTIRRAIREHSSAQGLLRSVLAYAQQEWLYV